MIELGVFPRIAALPPYVLAEVNKRTRAMREQRVDIINLGMGTPDGMTPEIIIEKLRSVVGIKGNNRYTSTVGLPQLRNEIVDRYRVDYGVELDLETETVVTVGVKDALAHLPVAVLGPGDGVVTHCPSYPIHIQGAVFAGGMTTLLDMPSPAAFLDRLEHHFQSSSTKPRMILLSFPHNPTTTCVDLAFFTEVIRMARQHNTMVVHDFAYSRLTFDGFKAPSILQVEGAREVAVELISLSKEYNISGWRCGFCVGNARMVGALKTLKSYLDYGVPLPFQIACIVGMQRCGSDVEKNRLIYQRRRDIFVSGLNRIGWPVVAPQGTIFLWARIPEEYSGQMDSRAFSQFMLEKAHVACSPGVGFGSFGEGWVRFALVENDYRLRQACSNIKAAFQGKSQPHSRRQHQKNKKQTA